MKTSEWLRVCDQVNKLWPSQPWKAGTADEAAALFMGVSAVAAHEAVRLLATSGREFAPPPGVLLQHAQAIEASLRPALADPDLTREATPEERERFARRWPEIKRRLNEIAAAKGLPVEEQSQ